MSDFPEIKSTHSLVAKYVTPKLWAKLSGIKTKTSGFTLAQAIACAVQFDDQHCGIYAGDEDSYKDFAEVFDPLIQEYHGISADAKHTSDMDSSKIKGNIDADVPVKSVRIRVGRSIQGFGLSPGITREQRLEQEGLMKNAFAKLEGDLAGEYFPLTGMNEAVRQKLVDDHFLFVSGDKNLIAAGMERDWPEGRGIYHNKEKTFLVWVNEEDQLRIISMQKGGDVKGVFERLARGISAVQDSVKKESGKDFQISEKYGYLHSCPTNLGTGMRASVHVDLPGWTAEGLPYLKARCEQLQLQPRGTRGESGGQTGITYDISNKHRLGYSEVELVQKMIDGVNILWREDKELVAKHARPHFQTSGEVSRLGAEAALAAAVEKSKKLGVKMNIAVVDNGANLVGFYRMDGAWLGSVDIAMKKAKTAVYFQMDTDIIGSLSQPGGSLFGIEHSNQGLITFPGGVPLVNKDGRQVGGVGVSGSTVEDDKAVAQAAAAVLSKL